MIPTKGQWHANPGIIREWRQNREIFPSSVVFVIKERKVSQTSVIKGIKAVGVWYQVEGYTKLASASKFKLCRMLGQI